MSNTPSMAFRVALRVAVLAGPLALGTCGQPTERMGTPVPDGFVEPPDTAVNFEPLDLTTPPESDLSIPCDNLRCRQVKCGEGVTTTIKGRVSIPSGELPLYNAIVYVPNRPEEVMPFKTGVTCETCGVVASGKPLVVDLTDENGDFELENAPAGTDIPLIIQMGRWRRQFLIPEVVPCEATVLPPKMLKFPSKKAQGDIPKLALATASADPFECLLMKIGIDKSEFTDGAGAGRIHIYKQNGFDMVPPVQPGSTLFNSLQSMKRYDAIILPCEGTEIMKSANALQNLVDYTSAGGRIFATHYSYAWLMYAPDPFPRTGEWAPNIGGAASPDPFNAIIDQTFPKGRAFAKWLKNVGASNQLGRMEIRDPRNDIKQAYKPPSQRWIFGDDQLNNTQNVMLHMTFNTPIYFTPPDFSGISMDGGVPDGGWGGNLQCGRVVFSDFHVSLAGAVDPNRQTFPDVCLGGPMTAQEKALTFMLFDLTACVTPDEEPPEVPIP